MFAALLLASARAAAQPMGPSPEASFAGVWRVVDARPAPWTTPRPLSATEVPLLEWAVAFRDGVTLGPASLSCRHATYGSTMVPTTDIFRGAIPPGKTEATATALGLDSGEVPTFRVACDTGTFDYHLDPTGRLLFARNDVVYAMERPEDPDVAPGYSGPSFDCTKARTAGEKVICQDSRLSKADRTMAAAYARLAKMETPQSFATVQASQRAWLAYTAEFCESGGPLPEDFGDQRTIRNCLSVSYDDRADRLGSVRVVTAGPLVIEPRMRFLSRAQPRTVESDAYPWMAGGTPAAAFNAFIAKQLALDTHRMDDKELFPDGIAMAEGMELSAKRTYTVLRFDPGVVSLQVSTYDYTGGAHEALAEFSLNWDVARGRPITHDSVFTTDAAWRRFVVDTCVKDLAAQIAEQSEHAAGPERAAVERVVADSANWLFAPDGAVVHFSPNTAAWGGEFDVKIPYSSLRRFLRPDSPVR
jgi:uncharacterized protein